MSKDKRKNWTMNWVAFIPNKGHVYVEYRDGKAVWLAGNLVGKREAN